MSAVKILYPFFPALAPADGLRRFQFLIDLLTYLYTQLQRRENEDTLFPTLLMSSFEFLIRHRCTGHRQAKYCHFLSQNWRLQIQRVHSQIRADDKRHHHQPDPNGHLHKPYPIYCCEELQHDQKWWLYH